MVTHTAKVQLLIDSEDGRKRWTSLYAVERLTDGRRGWRLVQQLGQRPGNAYEVWVTSDGEVRCTCMDASCRKHDCKHSSSLFDAGILVPALVPSPAAVNHAARPVSRPGTARPSGTDETAFDDEDDLLRIPF